jgi:hypothetical protein
MKNILAKILLISIIFIGIQFINSCSKDINDTENQISYELPTTLVTGVQNLDGILAFKDQNTFDIVLENLETENKNWLTRNSTSDKSQRDIVLQTFEEQFGFNSLRQEINEKEKQWLANSELDIQNDPDNHFIVGDELRSLFNVNNEIIIGSSIYKVFEGWVVIEIKNLDFKELEVLCDNNSFEYSQLNENCILHNPPQIKKSSTCKANIDNVEYENYATNYRSKVRITITNAPFIHFVKAEVTKYIFDTAHGDWDKDDGFIEVGVGGKIRDTDCDDYEYFSKSESEHDVNSLTAKSSFGGAVRVKQEDAFCNSAIDGIDLNQVKLEW